MNMKLWCRLQCVLWYFLELYSQVNFSVVACMGHLIIPLLCRFDISVFFISMSRVFGSKPP